MSATKLSEADAARLRVATFAPLVESDLRAIECHVGDGTLPDSQLDALLAWYEAGAWRATHSQGCPLSLSQRRQCKALSARAIARQHGGIYRAGGMDWRSDDGVELKAWVPGSR